MVIVRILWMSLLVLQIIVFLEIRNLLCGLTHSDWWRELLWVYILYEGHLVLFAHRRHRHMRDDDDDYLIVIRLGQYFGVLLPALFYRNSDYFEVDLRYLPSIDRTVGGSVGQLVNYQAFSDEFVLFRRAHVIECIEWRKSTMKFGFWQLRRATCRIDTLDVNLIYQNSNRPRLEPFLWITHILE